MTARAGGGERRATGRLPTSDYEALVAEREHPIETCFAEAGEMGLEWTYCPFCGGRIPFVEKAMEEGHDRDSRKVGDE